MSSDPNALFGTLDSENSETGDTDASLADQPEAEDVTPSQTAAALVHDTLATEALANGTVPFEMTSLNASPSAIGRSVKIVGVITSLTDNWGVSHNEEVVYGRIDPIPTYSNTTRTISVGIDLVPLQSSTVTMVQSVQTHKEVIGRIARMCYPSYESVPGNINFAVLKAPPMVEIRYSNIICDTNGEPLRAYLKSFSTNYQHDGLYALAGYTQANANKLDAYYNRISISMEFGVLHDEEVGYTSNGSYKGRFGLYPYFFPDEGE